MTWAIEFNGKSISNPFARLLQDAVKTFLQKKKCLIFGAVLFALVGITLTATLEQTYTTVPGINADLMGWHEESWF